MPLITDHEVTNVREAYVSYEEGRSLGERLVTLWDPGHAPSYAMRAVILFGRNENDVTITTREDVVSAYLDGWMGRQASRG